MTGPEHYREAERLLGLADCDVSGNWSSQTGELKADVIAAAQVHATLALAAATALPAVIEYFGDDSDLDYAWSRVIA